MNIQVYWDITQKQTRTYLDKYIQMLKDTNVNEVILMVNDLRDQNLSWDMPTLKKISDRLFNENIIPSIII